MANLRRQLDFAKDFAELALERVEDVSLSVFREAVWAIFEELVRSTPQYSGRAAANWNIGVGSPDLSVDYDAGDKVEVVDARHGGSKFKFVKPLHTGHERWVDVALERNRYKLRQITGWRQQIYISNAVQGDTDKSSNSAEAGYTYYLAALQSPKYWLERLRDENKPYTTVSEVMLAEHWRGNLRAKIAGERFFL